MERINVKPICRNSAGKRQNGASMIEMLLVAPFVLLLGLGTVQIGLLYHAKTTLNYATFEAARVGAVSHAQLDPMRAELAYRLAPVYGGLGSEESAGSAIGKSMADAINPQFSNITILHPTTETFDAWEALDNISGQTQIPNHHLKHQDAGIVRAGVNIHDANLLKIKAEYGFRMQVPFAGKLIMSAMHFFNPGAAVYYQAGRVPIESFATVRMQNESRRSSSTASAPIASTSEDTPEFTGTGAHPPGQGSSVASTTALAECDENGLGPVSAEFRALLEATSVLSISKNSDLTEEGRLATSANSSPVQEPGSCEASSSAGSILDSISEGGLSSSGLEPCG